MSVQPEAHTVLPMQRMSAGYASLWQTGSGLWSASTNLLYVHTVILLCSAISAVSLHAGCIVNRLMKGILCWFIMANQIKSSCQVTYVTVVCGKGLLCAHLEFVGVCVFNTQKNNLIWVLCSVGFSVSYYPSKSTIITSGTQLFSVDVL